MCIFIVNMIIYSRTIGPVAVFVTAIGAGIRKRERRLADEERMEDLDLDDRTVGVRNISPVCLYGKYICGRVRCSYQK